MATANSNGLTLDYQLHGAPQGPALLLIMGLGMPAAAWPPALIEALAAAGLRVIAFDNRDCGRSSKLHTTGKPRLGLAITRALLQLKVAAPYTLDDMAADAIGLLDHLGIQQAHVVGASMGGMIAQQMAARYPQRVSSLASIMSTTGNPDLRVALGRPRAIQAVLHKPVNPLDVEQVTQHLVRLFGIIGSPGHPTPTAVLRERMQHVAQRGYHPAGTARQLLAILACGDRRRTLASIRAPTLIVHGTHDPLLPLAAGRDSARCIPGAQLLIIDGMGHDLAPGVLPAIVQALLANCRRAAPLAPQVAAA